MVAWVWLCDGCVLTALLPVKLTGIYDNAAQSSTVTADELCSRVNNNVYTVLDWTNQVWSTEGVIYNNRQTMLVCQLGDRIQIRNITVWVAQRFQVDCLGVLLNCILNLFQIVCVNRLEEPP